MAESAYWSRFWQRRISRRALLGAGGTLAAGAAAAAVAGCGGGNGGNNGGNGGSRTGATPDAELTPVPGGKITQGRFVNALGIDPHVDITGLDVDLMMYSYLYSWNRFTEEAVFNNLATDFEHPDDLTFIFTIRPDAVNWPFGPAAGEPLTSEDCVASFKRRGTALTAPDKRFPMRIATYETPSPTVFKFVMGRPFVPSIREMANPTWAIVSAKVLEKYPNLSQQAFGTGPFVLDEFRGSERIELSRHKDYFLKPQPWLDSLTYIIITENSSLLSAFKSGQHDVNGAILTRTSASDLIDDADFRVTSAPSLFYPVIHLKMKDHWRDVRVREALDLAIHRDEIISSIQDGEGNYNGPIQWPQRKWALPQDELRAFYRYDPERARQLLDEAGFGTIKGVMKVPDLVGPTIFGDMALLIKDQVSKVGFDIELDFVELGAFISNVVLPGNFDMTFFPNLPADEPDRPLSFYHSRGISGSGNWNNYSNPELDKLIDAQAEEFDEPKRQQIILEAQRMILPEYGPQLTLTGGTQFFAHWSHVHYGAEGVQTFGGLLEPPDPDAKYGPTGTEVWTERAT
jgi:peptide/nickel transport system substrate-binding protein